ncbi:MAG: bifunctional adenosylcobinamide kinase/adenosylcobinamide-phosphate guanylyltransferase [Deltaproteobacteria bacterium]|nr:bifunctional adenosylcobinamide kinase/adenosylcobinamide-phosphate guanylyltransferase [Deltaproteobacteria bacterium]
MGEITLILGGAKSGKTSLALAKCLEPPPPWIYLATAEARDGEMTERITRHKAERGPGWRTMEEPLYPVEALSRLKPGEASVVLLDCLTLWLSNLMTGQGLSKDETWPRVLELTEAALAAPCPVIMVSNELGLGIVPENRLARDFRDASGAAHQYLAAKAREVLFIMAGLSLKLK